MEQERKRSIELERATAECRALRDYVALLDKELHGENVPLSVKANVDDAFQIITGLMFTDWLRTLDELQRVISETLSVNDLEFIGLVQTHQERVKNLLTFINMAATEAVRLLSDEEAIEHTRILFVVHGQKIVQSFLDWAQPKLEGADGRANNLDATLF